MERDSSPDETDPLSPRDDGGEEPLRREPLEPVPDETDDGGTGDRERSEEGSPADR